MICTVVYHIAFEDLGSFAQPLRERGYSVVYRHAGIDPLTRDEWRQADLVVVLGGPLGVQDTAQYPWLATELGGVQARLAHKLPTLGICLGAQLMATALGGGVEQRRNSAGWPRKEIGWSELALAPDAGVLEALRGVPVLHWHGDNIVLPDGVTAQASTAGTPCQAFAIGHHALGLQFHAEFTGAAQEAWLSGHALELAQAGVDLAALREDTARHADALALAARALLGRWLDLVQR